MKTPISVLISLALIAVIAYSVTFTGCINSVTSTGTVTAPATYPALTERDFIDTNFYAVPGSVVMLHLEHLHSPIDTVQHDTDSLGVDVFRIRVPRTAEHTFRMGDSSNFKVTLIDKATRTIVCQVDPVNNFVTVTIPAGDYIVVIRSLVEYTGGANTHQNVFIQPDMSTTLNRGGGNQEAYADTNSVHTLLTTNSCVSCDLSYANLGGANLGSANLTNADLNHANLNLAYLTEAILSNANLSYTNLTYAYSIYANYSNANLSYADLSNASLNSANLTSANLNHTKLNYANLNFAIMGSANLTYAYLNYAILTSTNLSHANLNHANLSHAITGTTDLTYTDLTYANLTYANVPSSKFMYSNLSNANLSNSNFTNSNLSYAILSYANLTNVNLTNTTLNNANFCNAIKTGIIITGVHTNSGTQCWP